ncbi:MAG: hypothetical protein NWE92_01700 [Candidatus Bathyarchaeota archaeon]|nr:hypothetical protein [Candidatus Bathyarchaeota archaeon]
MAGKIVKPRREYDVHDIISAYPYFLGLKYASMQVTHEKIYPNRKRSDFVFSDDQEVIMVEVKKGYIDSAMLDQAFQYMNEEKKQRKNKKLEGILIGLPARNPELDALIASSEFNFSKKYLGIDVPTNVEQIKFCAETNCRKANWYYNSICQYCGSSNFIRDPFAFSR